LLIPGAINAIVVPRIKIAPSQALFSQLLVVVAGSFAGITAIGWGMSDAIVSALAPGFGASKHALTVQLTRAMMPSLFFIGVSAYVQGVLSAHNRFLAAALANIVGAVVVVGGMLGLGRTFGIEGVGWAVTAGAASSLLVVTPSLRKLYRWRFALPKWQDPQWIAMRAQALPILVGLGLSQMYTLVERMFASTLGDAKLTALGLANTLFQLPLGIIAGALVVPLYPLLVEQAAQGDITALKKTAKNALRLQYYLLLPSTLAMILVPNWLVRLFYAHGGKVSLHDVQLTAHALIFLALGTFGWVGRDMLTRVYYALENTRTPVLVSAASFLLYIGLAWAFIPWLDYAALACAYAASATAQMFLLGLLLKRTFWLKMRKIQKN
jgi:putative peptidoglycan lipid II flippase